MRFLTVLVAVVVCSILMRPVRAEESRVSRRLFFSMPGASQGFGTAPYGLQAHQLAALKFAGLKLEALPRGGKTGGWGDFALGAADFSSAPIWVVGGGYLTEAVGGVLGIGLEIENATALKAGSAGGNPLATWKTSASIRYFDSEGFLRPSVELKWLSPRNALFAKLEGLETRIGWKSTYAVKPALSLHFPLVAVEGGLAIYSLGAAAIASKEFGYSTKDLTVYQPHLAVTVALGPIEVRAKASKTLMDGATDTEEFVYQAPFLYSDYLLSKTSVSGEARWRF